MIHVLQILNNNPRTPTPTQCVTPSSTPPRQVVVQANLKPLHVKIEPLDLTPTTTQPSPPIKAEPMTLEISVQSRQAAATEGQLHGRVYKAMACAAIAPKHDVTNEQDMKPLASRPFPVPGPNVGIQVVSRLPPQHRRHRNQYSTVTLTLNGSDTDVLNSLTFLSATVLLEYIISVVMEQTNTRENSGATSVAGRAPRTGPELRVGPSLKNQ